MGDIWKGLMRLDPVESVNGRVEVAYERGGKVGGKPGRFLPAWALYLLPLPEGADALVVVSRSLTMTIFYATRLRCSCTHDEPCQTLTTHDLAMALREHLSAGREIETLLLRYRELVAGVSVS